MRRVKDPAIIEWLAAHDGVWVHADNNAKIEHMKQILAQGVRTLWVYRPSGKMSTKEQLRVLAFVLPDFLQRLRDQPRQRHYEVRTFGRFPQDRVKLSAYNPNELRLEAPPTS